MHSCIQGKKIRTTKGTADSKKTRVRLECEEDQTS